MPYTDTVAPAASSPRVLSYQELDILHCLRGFCAFYVVVYHAKYILWAGGHAYLQAFPRASWSVWQYLSFAADMLSSSGYEMVIFFFVLSGFFIRYAQLRKPRAMGAFYLNRIARIYPPYLVSVALAVSVLAFVAYWVPQVLTVAVDREFNTSLLSAWQDVKTLKLSDVARTLIFLPIPGRTYLGYNSVYWSLLPEALFYATVPIAFWNIRAYYVVSVLGYLIGAVAAVLHYPLGGVLAFLLGFNFYFAVGVALYDVVVGTNWLAWVRRMPGWLLAMVAIGLFGLLLLLTLLKFSGCAAFVAVVLAVITVSALLAGRVSRHNLAVRLFHPIGVFSFSLYLYHFPLLILLSSGLTALTGDLIFYSHYYWLAVPVVTLGCYLLYLLTERIAVNFFRKM